MKFSKSLKIVALLCLIFPMFLVNKVSAAESGTVNITLHKLLFEYGNVPDETLNNGTDNPFLTDFRGLDGVTFEAQDVTDDYYKYLAEGKTQKEVLKDLAASEKGSVVAEEVTATVGNEAGIATFSLPAKDSQGRDKVYRFVETDAPEEYVSEKATPMVVVLPIYDENENVMTDVHLYPKNEGVQYTEPPFEKVVDGDKDDFEAGEEVPFTLTTQIPVDAWTYTKFNIVDKADDILWFNADSLEATLGGKVITEGFTLTPADHGFTFALDPSILKDHLGEKLELNYTMTLKGDLPEESYVNDAILYPGPHDEIESEVTIYTGGKNFVKVDLKDEKIHLTNAKFAVRNTEGKYLLKVDGKNTWIDVKDPVKEQENLTLLASDEKGNFSINGLSYGEYELVEVVAPEGYVLSETPVTFTVEKGSLTGDAAVALSVVNQKIPETPEKPEVPGKPETPETPKDPEKPQGSLPQTGEKVAKGASVLGLVLIGIALIIFFARKRKEERN